MLGIPPHTALSTNKLSSTFGTISAIGSFAKSGLVLWKVALFGLPFSLLGAPLGSLFALYLEPALLGKVLVVLLFPAFALTIIKPSAIRTNHRIQAWKIALICFCIGLYDGFFGPGTGSFLILAFYSLLGMELLHASAIAKVLNGASNLSSAITFIFSGSMLWALAIPMACMSIVGNILGSRFAIHTGAKSVRYFLRFVMILLLITLIVKYCI